MGVGVGGGWGISFIFTSGQHCQMIDCANKYFCYSCNLYYIRDCFFKKFFFCCISLLNYCNVHLHHICAKILFRYNLIIAGLKVL